MGGILIQSVGGAVVKNRGPLGYGSKAAGTYYWLQWQDCLARCRQHDEDNCERCFHNFPDHKVGYHELNLGDLSQAMTLACPGDSPNSLLDLGRFDFEACLLCPRYISRQRGFPLFFAGL